MQAPSGKFLETILAGIIQYNVTSETEAWLTGISTSINQEENAAELNLAFASVPRKTGRKAIIVNDSDQDQLKEIHPQFTIDNWTTDRLCRVWLLLQVNDGEKEKYIGKIENLFKAAEMNELVALYSALPGLSYPEAWRDQCAEGIRSNIGNVLEAIMYNNPYPFQYLSQPAWNQLILKAIFTDKDVKRIIGLDERKNQELATILIDYANERRAAHRTVNPQLWRLISSFIDQSNFSNVKKAFESNDPAEKNAAALACFSSDYAPAKKLVEQEPQLHSAFIDNKINWSTL